MILEQITINVLAEKLLNHFDSKSYVAWALEVLKRGYENDNLYILAGLDYAETKEREDYFQKTLKDLQININQSEDALIDSYAISLANQAILRKIDIKYAFKQMLKIVRATGYAHKYFSFYAIEEDLICLKNQSYSHYGVGITLENFEEFMIEEFKIFLAVEKLNIPGQDLSKTYCDTCKQLSTPKNIIKFRLSIPFKRSLIVCDICNNEINTNLTQQERIKNIIEYHQNK